MRAMRAIHTSIVIGQNVQRLRERRGLSIEQLAALIDISSASVAAWEAGLMMPASTLWDMSRALDVGVCELLIGAEE